MSEKEFLERILKILNPERLGKYIDTDIRQNEINELADLEDLYPVIINGVPFQEDNFFELIEAGFDFPYIDKNGNSKTFNFNSRKSLVQFYKDMDLINDIEFKKAIDEFSNSEDLDVSREDFLQLVIQVGKRGEKFTGDKEYFKKKIMDSSKFSQPISNLLSSNIIYQYVKDYLNNSLYVNINSVLDNVEEDLKNLLKEVANNDEYVKVLNRLLEEVKSSKDIFNKDCELENKKDKENVDYLNKCYSEEPSVQYGDLVDVDALADKMLSECSKYNDYSLDEVARAMFPYIPSNYTLKSDFVELSLVTLNNSEYINDNGKPYTTQDIASYLKRIAENGFDITEQQSNGRKK